MKKLFTTVWTIFFFLLVSFSQDTSTNSKIANSEFYFLNKDFFEKAIVAVVGALFGFLFNYLLARRKEKRDTKELSYELTVKNVITKEESPIKDNISLIYRNNTVPNLTFVS